MRSKLQLVGLGLTVLLLLGGCGARDGLNQNQSGGYYPPDNNIAVGPAWVVEAVNIMLRMTNRSNGNDVRYFSPQTITGCTDTLGDPRIEYDLNSGRWFLVVITQQDWCLAVSQTNDPTGSWYRYTFRPALAWFGSQYGDQQPFPDYPGLGITIDKIVLTGNLFHFFTGIAKVKQSGVAVVSKANLVSGQAAAWQYFNPPRLAADGIPGPTYFLQPCVHYWNSSDNTTWLAGTNAWADPKAERLALYSIGGTPGVGGGAVLFGPQFYDFPYGRKWAIPPRAKQKGTTARVETNDHRVLDVVCQGNRMTVAAHHGCTPPGDDQRRSCLRFMQFDYTGTGWNLARDTRLREFGRYYYFPAIAVNRWGEVVSVFNRSSANNAMGQEYPSVYASGMRAYYGSDVLAAPQLLRAGLSPWLLPRWGDYSGAHLDVNLDDVWLSGMYPLTGNVWGTWIAPASRANFPP